MKIAAMRDWWMEVSHRLSHAVFAREQAGAANASSASTANRAAADFATDFTGTPRGLADGQRFEEALNAARPLSILLPTDFSRASLLAVDCALRMAKQQRTCLTLLHAVHLNLIPHGPANAAKLRTELCHEALAKAEPILEAARNLGVTGICMLVESNPAKAIADAARRCAPDLIIMTGSKPRGWRSWFGRHIVKNVVRSVPCPVLVLPAA